MKKHFLAILVLMALCLFGGNAKADSKTYSFYSPGDNTLSFYYSADGTIPRRHQDGNNGGTYYYIGGKWEHHYNGDTYADNIYKVVFDASLKNSDVKYIQNWLTGLKNLKSVTGWENIKPTNTTNLQGMFKGCTSLTSLGDFYNFNTSNVKTMESMFEGCTSLRYVDLSGLNLKKLESMTNMFKGCTNLRVVDLRGCSTASLTYAEGTFYGCSNLETIFATTSWISPKNSNNGLDMFTGCTKLRAKEEYNPSRTSSYYASVDYYFTIDGRDSYPVEGYARYYKGTLTFYYDKYRSTTTSYALEKIAGDYVLNSGTDEPGWLKKHKNNITTVIFDESFKNIAPKSCSHWFFECNNLTTITNIENLKLYNCATVDYMFSGCTSLVSLDLSKIDLSQNKVLKNFSYMFSNCSNLKNLKLPQRDHLCTTCSMKAMFKECTKLTNIDFMQGFSTKYATDMSYMFAGTGITQVPGDCLILLECEDMSWMFYNCQYLKTVKLGHNVAASPQNTNNMFANCGKLEYVFLGDSNHDFSMAKVTNIGYMFSQCTQLKAIFVGSEWNTSKVTNSSYCFQGCSNLMGMNGTKFSSTNTNKTYARLDKDGQKGYLSTYQSTITFKECTFGKKTYKADEPLTISDPTKKGYVFQGWTGTGLSSYTKKLTLPIYSSGDREYTANWLKDLSYSYYYIQATPSSYTYNGKAITYTVTLDGKELKEGTDYTVGSSPGTIKDAKTYNLTIVGNEANGYIYSKQLSFTISPAKVTIKPDAISKTYGDADPAKITYTYTGFCGSDGFTSAPVFKRATGENVGEYSYSLYTSPKYNSNYYASYDYSNKFTIRPKPITVTPAIISKTYGDVDPEITYSANGLINSDKLSGALSREEGENVGEYSVTIGTLKNANYDISVADVKFSIIPKTLTTPTIVTESEVYPYNGSEIIPAVSLYDNDKLIDPSEYTVTISNNNGIGNGQITITDNPGGNYNVSGKGEFQIVNPNSVCKVTIKSSGLPNAEDKTLFAKKGESIKAPIDFAYEGYTLTGVYKNSGMSQQFTFESDIVESDITLYANWKINSHTLEFVVDGVSVSSVSVDYGTEITAPEQSKTGYTFAWTDNIPATMPDNDLTINGAFTVNVHRLVYKLDGKEYHAEDKEYGKSITALASPAYRDGYVFSGWSKVPATMPDNDVEITGSYIPNKHKVTFITYDEEIAVETAYNVSIASILPEKPGLRFVPKAGSPTKVPDYDITIEGTFEVRTYAIKYVVDYDVYKTVDLYLGDPITVIAAPTKTGYTFSGWSEAPATMPANDIEITGKFTANQHTVTYYIDGEVFKTVTLSYGSRIYPPSAPYKAGLRFAGWGDIPETMPDNDLEIRGTFSSATPVAEVAEEGNGAKVWSYNRTIYIETAPDTKYTIIDLQGRMITTSTTKSSHDEISVAPKGIMIVIINNKSYKVSL